MVSFIGEYPESVSRYVSMQKLVFLFLTSATTWILYDRSPHEHADANMVEIDKNLAKMRDNLVVTDPMQGVTLIPMVILSSMLK